MHVFNNSNIFWIDLQHFLKIYKVVKMKKQIVTGE